MKCIFLATEDSLSEEVGAKLISEIGTDIHITNKLRNGGNGYLKSKMDAFCKIAIRTPVLLITDLDTGVCASSLISRWLNGMEKPDNLLFRVAVREIESWLLADEIGMKELFVRGATRLPPNPDSLPDPKRSLLELARRAPRAVRDDLVAERGVVASQGLGYNLRLGTFVRETWSPLRASDRSDSLARTRRRLKDLFD